MWLIIVCLVAFAGVVYILHNAIKDAKEMDREYYSSMEERENDCIDEHSPLNLEIDKVLKVVHLRNKLNAIEKKRKPKKKMKTLLMLILFCIPLSGMESMPTIYIVKVVPINPYEFYFDAVCRVESDYNPSAVNLNDPNGGSFGIAQIGQQMLDSYNESCETDYVLTDCFDVGLSKRIFIWHCMKYNNMEVACRSWNGGYNSMNMESTLEYWNLIKLEVI